MRFLAIAFSTLLLFTACQSKSGTGGEGDNSANKRLYLPKWNFLAKASAVFNDEYTKLPKRVYVFPALRVNPQGQPTDELAYRTLEDNTLGWYSPAPLGLELKLIVEKKMRQLGFVPVSFGDLTASSKDHSILVVNLYYAEASASRDNPDADEAESWTTFSRISAATFPKDLNPAKKRDLMNQELVSLFNGKEKGRDVIKYSHAYLLDFIGQNRQWSESLNLLN
ncbi:MAG: hypothetical protein GVY36_11765 [Verrucomicrobia bacterium]|jgi:hypothetical protein|nr:hypothetical protein [Verrucomicrobiota bacterium]